MSAEESNEGLSLSEDGYRSQPLCGTVAREIKHLALCTGCT